MRTRSFGTTDLRCSEIGFGTWALGSNWWGTVTSGEGVNLIRRAIDLGITFFDTGDVYGKGANEEIVGRAPWRACRASRSSSRPSSATRSRSAARSTRRASGPRTGPRPTRATRWRRSLRRLGTDYVDLYQLHNPRMDAIERDDLFEELERLRDEGKLRHYGVALGPAIGWRDEGLRALEERDVDLAPDRLQRARAAARARLPRGGRARRAPA